MSLGPNSRMQIRKKMYKVSVDAEEVRLKREDNMIQIRKINREEKLLKKRREGLPSESRMVLESIAATTVTGIWTDDRNLQLEGITYITKLLSIEKSHSSIDEVINADVVPRLVEFLAWHNVPQLQVEAAWALTNIAGGNSGHVKIVIDNGAVPILVHLLRRSPSDNVREEVVWALGNIAGDSSLCRDLVLRHGALKPLLAHLNNQDSTISMLRISTWALCNLCYGEPFVTSEVIKPALAALAVLIRHDDKEILSDACWALSYLSGGTEERIQDVIDAGVCPKLVQLLLHPCSAVVIPALRTVGGIMSKDDAQTQLMINNGLLSCLLPLLTNNGHKKIAKSACWTVSNITAGTEDQIQTVIDANIIPPVVQLLQTGEFGVKKEAIWAISNAISCGSRQQIKYIADQGCVKLLCDFLAFPDPTIVTICLEGIEIILNVGEMEKKRGNNYAKNIEDFDGLEKIENLQTHTNHDIYEKAVKIIETYWNQEDENITPKLS